MAGLKVITPPANEPVTLAEIKTQLKYEVDDTSPDDILTPLIPTARAWCEEYQNRAYISQTLEIALDDWPCGNAIQLPRPPLQSITSLTYTDDEGADTVWASSNYLVDDYAFVGRLVKKRSVCWPTSVCLAEVNGVRVRYIAGYGTVDDVPEKTKQAIIMLVMHWYDNGICEPPGAVKALLNTDRVMPV